MIISRSIIVFNLAAIACLWAAREYHITTSVKNSASQGPDVIVGSIPDIFRWGSSGNSTSFSIATTSCNIGTARMDWIQNSTLHPVISQNLYRVKNGRIEQVGMSWLKHGFSVAAGSLCNTCTDPNSAYLGVGCSDPYGASLNGSQGGLGPRSQVNAVTGAFAWPKGNLPSTGVLDGRIRVLNNDLIPSQNIGARYFVESQYIHPQDAASGNDLNNAGYREAFVEPEGSTGWDLEVGAPPTVREQPAINAWQAVHPDVQLFLVDVPDDGRIIVGMRTTPRIGGGYHTEFAVNNFNSHRSVRSFNVRYGSGEITNPGFHDVDYQFEPYSGTDWTPLVVGNEIEWSTQTFAANPNANAIRWNTLYSFWCDSELPPRTLTLGLFRPGAVAEMTIDLTESVVANAYKLNGAVAIGNLADLMMSDNQYFNLSPVSRTQKDTLSMLIGTTYPTNSPSDFAFKLDATLAGEVYGNVVQTIELRNFNTGQLEMVDVRPAEVSAQLLEITPTGDWSRFINPKTNVVQANVEWTQVEPLSSNRYSWSINIDELTWLTAD